MKEQLVSITIGLGSALLGLALELTPIRDQVDVLDAVHLGCFAYIIAVVVFFDFRLQKIRPAAPADDLAIRELRNIVLRQDCRSFDLLWLVGLMRARAGKYEFLTENSFVVTGPDLPPFWRDAITRTYTSWRCTDMERTPEPWGCHWYPERALEFQRSAIADRASVCRIFIFRRSAEIPEVYRKLMTEQVAMGVEVKWLALDNKADRERLTYFEDRIDTMDFALIDSDYSLAFNISSKHEVSAVRCTKDSRLVQELRQWYETLWEHARRWERGEPGE